MNLRTQAAGGHRRATLSGLLVLATTALIGILTAGSAVPANGSSDLKVTKTASAGSVSVGTAFAYSIKVENLGPDTATGVTVTDTLPKQVDYSSASATSGTCSKQGGKVVCKIGTLEAGPTAYISSATVTVNVVAKKAGTAKNTATATADQKDPVGANSKATATVQITQTPTPRVPTCRGVAATIVGTRGADQLTGTPGRDVVVAFAGGDSIATLGGSDLICAGAGDDVVNTAGGGDRVLGAGGRDHVRGGRGPDRLKGGRGNDALFGNAGPDRLVGGRGRDRCRGGAGLDTLRSCEH
jgi:uncharacterized repeat protein (TIGR01451 family)